MTWAKMLFLFLLMGCTIKVEPLPQRKPVKHAVHKQYRARPHESPTPTPTPTPETNRPMQLEPLSVPTPMIKIPPKLSTANMFTVDNIITF